MVVVCRLHFLLLHAGFSKRTVRRCALSILAAHLCAGALGFDLEALESSALVACLRRRRGG